MSELWVPSFTRRALLRAGGVASLGALVAACGDRGGDAAPGRVGQAPVVTDRPTGEVDDLLLLRTAQSLEYTAIAVYERFGEEGLIKGEYAEPFERFVGDHRKHAGILGGLIDDADGEQFECPNPWLMERAVAPILDNILGNEAQDIPESDNPARDATSTALAFENLAGATYQSVVAFLSARPLRAELMRIAAQEVRHASVIAMLRTSTPKAFVSPLVAAPVEASDETATTPMAEDAATASDGTPTPYVLTNRFGELGAATLVIGKANEAGTRFTATVETPRENSFIYEEMRCDGAPAATTTPSASTATTPATTG